MRFPISRPAVAAAAALLLLSTPAAGQEPGDWERRCERWNRDSDREHVCEERETRIAARGELKVDGRQNGGVSVRAHDGRDVVVRARIQAAAPTEREAREIASRIRVNTSGATIHAEGPDVRDRRSWSVSYEILVPARTNLDVETRNGPVSVDGVTGEMDLRAVNGPMNLRAVGGDVRARTTNGPLNVRLEGRRWSGRGLDAETVNGPVTLSLPRGYSAELDAGTVRGPVNLDIPVTVRGRTNRVRTRIGEGGPPIRVMTTNGPVAVRQR